MHCRGKSSSATFQASMQRGTTDATDATFCRKAVVSQFRLATSVYSHYDIMLYISMLLFDIPWRSLSPFLVLILPVQQEFIRSSCWRHPQWWKDHWSVVSTILKNMKVNGKDHIPYLIWKIKFMFETTTQITIEPRNITVPPLWIHRNGKVAAEVVQPPKLIELLCLWSVVNGLAALQRPDLRIQWSIIMCPLNLLVGGAILNFQTHPNRNLDTIPTKYLECGSKKTSLPF